MTQIQPNVSVCTIAFNHAHCVTDCIKGVQEQDYDGSIQHVIADDKSTDRTRHAIRNAIETNSNINYDVIEQDYNVGMNKNLIDALAACDGDIIALCEGDDFWIDPTKLRRQVRVLQESPNIPMATHDCYRIYYPPERHRTLRRAVKMFYWDARVYGPSGIFSLLASIAKGKEDFWSKDRCKLEHQRRRTYHLEHFVAGTWIQPFCSIVMRRQLVTPLIDCLRSSDGGHQLALLLGAIFGGIIHDRRPMAVKRDQQSSVTLDSTRRARVKVLNQSIKTNNRIKRYRSILAYCNAEQQQIVHRMIDEHLNERNIVLD